MVPKVTGFLAVSGRGMLDILSLGKQDVSCWVDFCSSREPSSAEIQTFPTSCFRAGQAICTPYST